MTYRQLLKAIEVAHKRKYTEERAAEELFQSSIDERDNAEARLRAAQKLFDAEIGE